MKNICSTFLLLLCISAASWAQTAGKNYEFRNGQWFDGDTFVTGTWYVSNGMLSKKAPSKVDSVIDLTDKWVVPPFGDANCASVADNPNGSNVLKMYLNEGVFYLQIMGNTREGRSAAEAMTNKPGAPDAVFANGGITCSLGYPFIRYEGPANGIKNPNMWGLNYEFLKTSSKMLGDGYWFIDNKTALDANWEKIKAQKPALISIYLLDVANKGGQESAGLSADMAKNVLKKAHKAGLRVYAYVETAEDLRLGMKLGVDGFANLPGHEWNGVGDGSKYALSDDDIKKLAKKKTPVVALFSHSQTVAGRKDGPQANIKFLKQLLENGVNLVIGSDDPQRTTHTELNYWYSMGALDNKLVIKVLCENTPKAIFPKRKIGKLDEGYEANFLVLGENPLNNLLKARLPQFKVKQGLIIK